MHRCRILNQRTISLHSPVGGSIHLHACLFRLREQGRCGGGGKAYERSVRHTKLLSRGIRANMSAKSVRHTKLLKLGIRHTKLLNHVLCVNMLDKSVRHTPNEYNYITV